MPVQSCRAGGRPGYKWGASGKCYSYPSGDDAARREAKRKAVIQGIVAGERPAYNAEFAALVAAYESPIRVAATLASVTFAVTADASDWQPPVEGAILTVGQLRALGDDLNEVLRPIWEKIITDVAAPLATIEIAWDVKHPLAQNLLDQAAKRTGDRLGEAVQFTLRDTIKHAYDNGLDVRDTAALIQSKIAGAAPYQAEMLARTDLNSLANGSSHAAAQLMGMEFKTWDATLDAVTRPTHADAHGQTVPLNDSFDVGGEEAMYPGDPALSDAEAANCRCTLIYGETLDEAQGLLADGGGTIMADMATKEQRRKRYERRAAHAQGKVKALPKSDFFISGETTSATSNASNVVSVFTPAIEPDLIEALTAAPRAIRFSGTAAIEGQIADDNSLTPRVLLPDSLEWPEMPVPFMAQTVTAEGHDGAEAAGRVDEYARKKSTGKKRNIYMAGELTTPYGVNEIAPMIEDKTMRFVSIDLGATEWAIVGRTTFAEIPQDELSIEDLTAGTYALGLMSGKIKATTLVPTQALEGAMIALVAAAQEDGIGIEPLQSDEMFALVASSGRWSPDPERIFQIVVPSMLEGSEAPALVASPAPVNPPRAWFETAEPPGKMPLTITKEGRVYGHLATWDSCHVSFLPSCVPPPKSASSYAYMHTSELDTEDGDTVTVGKLMFSPDNGGHADRRLSAAKASAYYDKTGMAAAFIRVVDGAHGIWAAGALNPDLTDEQRQQMRRELRLNPPSGDWRPINGQYELICGLAVAVPGFPVPRVVMSVVASGEEIELCDALIASSGLIEADPAAITAMEHLGLVDEDMLAERQIKALAARAQGLDSLAALVDP